MSVVISAVGAKVASVAYDNAVKMLFDLSKGDSLVGYAQAGNLHPPCLVDEDVRNSDMLPEVLQLAQSVYAAYFLRAFSMHNISINNANVAARLDKFSTHRSPGLRVNNVALEEFEDRLPVPGDERVLPEEIQELQDSVKAQAGIALESISTTVKGQQPVGKNTPTSTAGFNQGVKEAQATLHAGDIGNVNYSKSVDINDPVNVGVGRLVNVTIKENNCEVTFPVAIRLDAMYMGSAPLVQILSYGSEDISFGARFKKWRLGGIDFWRDLMWCQDMIDAHKSNLKADKSGIYLQLMQKRRKNGLAAVMSGETSANNASGITIMSRATADALEMKIYGKLKDFNTRQKLFQQGYGMLMFIIDKQWGRVTMYTRDIPEHTELSERDLKASNKSGGVDIGDVLQAYRVGMSPKF